MILKQNDTAQTLKDLRPLIEENYRARAARELPDEWFWADELAMNLGADYEYYRNMHQFESRMLLMPSWDEISKRHA